MEDADQQLERAKRASTVQLLFRAARLLNEVSIERMQAVTGHDVRVAHTRLFPHIDLDGTRITEIARRAGVSKQAVSPLVDELVEQGVLERIPDPRDGRAKLVRFARVETEDGDAYALMSGLRVLREIEADYAERIGPERWKGLRDGLTALVDALE